MKFAPWLLTVIVSAACTFQSKGQTVSFLTFAGYTFADKVNFNGGYGKLDDCFQWAAGFEVAFSEDRAFALIYQQMLADASLNGTLISESARVGMHYIMGSATHYQSAGPFTAFGSIDLGACILNPRDRGDLENAVRFAWGARVGLGGGDRVKFRIYGQVYSPVQSAGGGFYFNTGGSGVGVTAYSSLYQFGLGASLSFKLLEF